MNQNDSKDVSVIIVNYNTKEITKECVESIFRFTQGVGFEVIVVDNASTDGSKDFFSNDDRIIYVCNEENYGFGKANNIGAKIAKGKYLFFLNSDTYLKNDALSLFFDYAEKHPEEKTGFWGTLLLDTEGHPNGSGGPFPTLKHSLALAAHVAESHEFREEGEFEPFSVDYVLGADLFVTKDVFDCLGGFDEAFFMYYEESDLQRRAYKKGYGAKIIPGPKIVHLEGKSTGTVSHKKRMMVENSHMIHLKKYYPRVLFDLFLVIYILLKIPVFMTRHYTFQENCDYFRLLCGKF